MPSVIDILEDHGPCLTTDIVEVLTTEGISEAAARQRIHRSLSRLKRLAGLRFAKNARFVFLEHQYGDDQFWESLEKAFVKAGPAYWFTVIGLKARGGRCLLSHFPIVCGAPAARKRNLSPDRILERLLAINLLELVNSDDEGQKYVQFKPHFYTKASEANSVGIRLAEELALFGVRDWARKIGFGSYNVFKTRFEEPLPIVSGVAWDLSAPSYARPLSRIVGGKVTPGFLVCDVNLNGVLSREYIESFIRKHDTASAPIKVAPILPILVGDVYAQDAYDLARQKGITAVTIATLFGDEVRKSLQDLIQLISDSGATAAVNPEFLARVLGTLTKIEGAANNLRGALFEFVIGSLVKDVEGGYLIVGLRSKVSATSEKFEVDVILNRDDEAPILFIECKSKIPGSQVSVQEVERWYADRVPLIQKAMSVRKYYIGRDFQFELWTNGTFHPDALAWLDSQEKEFDSYSVDWRDGAYLKQYAAKCSSATIRETLNDYYFKHPLNKLAKQNKEKVK